MALTEEEKLERRRARCRRYYQENKAAQVERKRIYREENRDLIRSQERARRAADPEKTKEQARKHKAAQRVRNPEKQRDHVRAARAKHPERSKESNRLWQQQNPERMHEYRTRRRARKQNATLALFPVTAEVIAERLALTDGCCYCGSDAPLELEHVVALSAGGFHIPSNLLGACRSCNSSKGDRPVEEWFRAQPFFSEQRWQLIQELTNG